MNLADGAGISSAWFLAPLLVAVILFDLRQMRIPNALVALFLAVFVATVPLAVPLEALAWRVAAALVVLVLGLAAFAVRVMGGGDVKILAALALLIPTALLAHFALILSICMVAGLALLTALRFALRDRDTGWKGLHDRRRYPMGLSIGMAGLLLLYLGPDLAPAL